jgi:hypothetical protein
VSARAREKRRRRIEIPSAGQTAVSLALRGVDDGGPWPLTRVLTALAAFDVERVGVARALGDRRGIPLVHSQELRWGQHAVFIEARHGRDGSNELMLELPAWDELVDSVDDDVLWHLIDTVAAAADAHFGSIGDGEPAETALPDDARMLRSQLGRHLALLLPEWTSDDINEAGTTIARVLRDSGLLLVTR